MAQKMYFSHIEFTVQISSKSMMSNSVIFSFLSYFGWYWHQKIFQKISNFGQGIFFYALQHITWKKNSECHGQVHLGWKAPYIYFLKFQTYPILDGGTRCRHSSGLVTMSSLSRIIQNKIGVTLGHKTVASVAPFAANEGLSYW